jgi:hypothetical protein
MVRKELGMGDLTLLPQKAASISIHEVILWTNGMVMVFDTTGEQMPEYQGSFNTVFRKIQNVYSGAWLYGNWNKGIVQDVPFYE